VFTDLQLPLEGAVMHAAITSAKDWVANKAWRLRNHFKLQGWLGRSCLTVGEKYKGLYPDRTYEAENVYPSKSELEELVSRENVLDWLSILGGRVDLDACMQDRDISRRVFHVYTLGLR